MIDTFDIKFYVTSTYTIMVKVERKDGQFQTFPSVLTTPEVKAQLQQKLEKFGVEWVFHWERLQKEYPYSYLEIEFKRSVDLLTMYDVLKICVDFFVEKLKEKEKDG